MSSPAWSSRLGMDWRAAVAWLGQHGGGAGRALAFWYSRSVSASAALSPALVGDLGVLYSCLLVVVVLGGGAGLSLWAAAPDPGGWLEAGLLLRAKTVASPSTVASMLWRSGCRLPNRGRGGVRSGTATESGRSCIGAWPACDVGPCRKMAGPVLGLWSADCGFVAVLRCGRTETMELKTGERGDDPRPTRHKASVLPAADRLFGSQSGLDRGGVSPVLGVMASRSPSSMVLRRRRGSAKSVGLFAFWFPCAWFVFLGTFLQSVLRQLCFWSLPVSAACMLCLLSE